MDPRGSACIIRIYAETHPLRPRDAGFGSSVDPFAGPLNEKQRVDSMKRETNSNQEVSLTHSIQVWYIYLHLPQKSAKGR